MEQYVAKNQIIGVIFWLLAIGVAGLGVYAYRQDQHDKGLAPRLVALEHKMETLSLALEDSNRESDMNKRRLQELSDRNAVVHVVQKSQDDLLTAVVSRVSPAVVSIIVSKDSAKPQIQQVNSSGNDLYSRDVSVRVPVYRQAGTERQRTGSGTGFIVRSDGYIVTNRHVADDAEAQYTALLSNGEQRAARVVYRDGAYDIAILKIEGADYSALTLGNSSTLKLGQTVAAIGNALGEYNNSVSVGIVSGLGRAVETIDERGRVEKLSGIIQTDAAINHGNSGGPLLDLDGRAVGVNVATTAGASNVSFAIPVNAVKPIIDRVLPY